MGLSPTWCSPPASTGATISAHRTASMSITGWLTTELAWLALTSLISCRRGRVVDQPPGLVISIPWTQRQAAAFRKQVYFQVLCTHMTPRPLRWVSCVAVPDLYHFLSRGMLLTGDNLA